MWPWVIETFSIWKEIIRFYHTNCERISRPSCGYPHSLSIQNSPNSKSWFQTVKTKKVKTQAQKCPALLQMQTSIVKIHYKTKYSEPFFLSAYFIYTLLTPTMQSSSSRAESVNRALRRFVCGPMSPADAVLCWEFSEAEVRKIIQLIFVLFVFIAPALRNMERNLLLLD